MSELPVNYYSIITNSTELRFELNAPKRRRSSDDAIMRYKSENFLLLKIIIKQNKPNHA